MPISAAELGKTVLSIDSSASSATNGDKAEESRAVQGLKSLLKHEVTTQLLVESQAGKVIKKLSKSSSSAVAEAAKEVMECWKALVKGTVSSDKDKKDTKPVSAAGGAADRAKDSVAAEPSGLAPASAPSSAPAAAPQKKHNLRVTGDSLRDGYVNSMADLLAQELHRVEDRDPAQVATEVEAEVSRRYAPLTKEYKTKFRTLHYNLSDKDNWELRTKVLLGEIMPSELVTMTDEQLASSRVKQEHERLSKEVLEKSVIHENASGARTQMYECGKCKKRDCTFYEKQTRSADEPMTVFITCLVCKNKWRMN